MTRSDKPLWNQLRVEYPHTLAPFRAWKRWLSVGTAAIAGFWIVVAIAARDRILFSSGAMSSAHAFLADQCEKCHTDSWQSWSGLWAPRQTDATRSSACLQCHAVSIGHDGQTLAAWHWSHDSDLSASAPIIACQACHLEHEGERKLSAVPDTACVQCHQRLTVYAPASAFAREIDSFEDGHPEFRVLASGAADRTRIQLNHALHLKPGLRSPGGLVQMNCADCHRAGRSAAPWPYGRPQLHEDAAITSAATEPLLQDDYMLPVRYSLHCQNCHQLNVDHVDGLSGGVEWIPHDSPAAIRTFLMGKLTEFAAARPEVLKDQNEPPTSQLPTLRQPDPKEANLLLLQWVNDRLTNLERKIYWEKKLCGFCHEQQGDKDAAALPVILSPAVPARWFEHASFSHERHRVVDCQSCHDRTVQSTRTPDVLLPSIGTCRQCHSARAQKGTTMIGGVSSRCTLCHTYHRPPSSSGVVRGRSIQELASPWEPAQPAALHSTDAKSSSPP